jgi:hypothetical protein
MQFHITYQIRQIQICSMTATRTCPNKEIVKFHNRGQKASNIKQKPDTFLCYHHGSEKQIQKN